MIESDILILMVIIIYLMFNGEYLFAKFNYCKNYENDIDFGDFTIIIPARNEENNISKLLESIKKSGFPLKQVIVVNDGSTDGTERFAKSIGAFVVNSEKLPDDWKGKPWACWQGANTAKTKYLFFLDADTFFEENGLEKVLSTYLYHLKDEPNGLAMSIAPFHKIEKFYESFSSIFNIIMVGSMDGFTQNKFKKPIGLYGQSLIIDKENYLAIDGHKSVKDKILENVFMAKLFLEKGVNLKLFGGSKALSFRMYPDGFKSLVDGWTKAFAMGAGQTPFNIMLKIILWITAGFMIPILLILAIINGNHIGIWSSFYFAFAFQTYAMLSRLGNFKFLSALFYPVYLVFYVIVFSRSLYYVKTKKSINWKSREVAN